MNQRRSIVDPYVALQIGMFITVVLMTIAVVVATSHAETSVKKTTKTITTVESEGEAATDTAAPPATPTESEMTAAFGSQATSGYSGCKTEELAKAGIKELKADCNAWIKDQKADLKAHYRTGACEEKCSDCQTGLLRCNVIGKIRYMK